MTTKQRYEKFKTIQVSSKEVINQSIHVCEESNCLACCKECMEVVDKTGSKTFFMKVKLKSLEIILLIWALQQYWRPEWLSAA